MKQNSKTILPLAIAIEKFYNLYDANKRYYHVLTLTYTYTNT